MNRLFFNRSFYFIAIALLASIIILSLSISSSSLISQYPELAIGITYDLTLTAPLLYLFLIWKTKIPNTTVVPFFILSIIVASLIIPADQQIHLSFIKKWIIPIVEIGVMSFIGFSVYKTVKTFRAVNNKDADILTVLEKTSEQVIPIPVLNKAIAFEISAIYYAFFRWRKPVLGENSFTYHKKSGKITLYLAIIFIIGIETIVLHFIVARWSEIIAWILTISSAYVLLQIFAHLKAVYQRPIEIDDNRLFVRYGLFSGTEIELNNIRDVQSSFQMPEDKKGIKQVALLGELEQFNTKIHLHKESTFYGLYGKKDKFVTLLLYVDEQEQFKKLITSNDSN
jgi:hypothetical protein